MKTWLLICAAQKAEEKVFLGTYQTRFSGKGRLILPKKMREDLKGMGKLVLTRGLDGGIWGFDQKVWEREARRELEIPVTDKKGREIRRVMFSGAEVVDLDKQGRFVIPTALLLQIRPKKTCILAGAGDHFEIWDPKAWEKILRLGSGED